MMEMAVSGGEVMGKGMEMEMEIEMGWGWGDGDGSYDCSDELSVVLTQ